MTDTPCSLYAEELFEQMWALAVQHVRAAPPGALTPGQQDSVDNHAHEGGVEHAAACFAGTFSAWALAKSTALCADATEAEVSSLARITGAAMSTLAVGWYRRMQSRAVGHA